jgi:hypothetical protein
LKPHRVGPQSDSILPLLVAAVLALCPPATAAAELDHSGYDAFLKKYVRDGFVNYSAVKSEDKELAAYLQKLEAIDPEEFAHWERDAKIALWINAYNAVTIYGITLNYPIEYGGIIASARFPKSSIRQIAGFWNTVFVKIMGAEITLDQIEHRILRKEFADPRVHFSLVCASVGCPSLSSDAYDGGSLQQQLERDVHRFINDEQKVRLDTNRNRIDVSSIFKWYAEDFRSESSPPWLQEYPKRYRAIMSTIARHVSQHQRDYMVNRVPSLHFLDYDWSLNELAADSPQ